MEKHYIKLEKKAYPKVEALSQDVFGYIDVLEIGEMSIYIMFMCNKKGIPNGTILNTYFDETEKMALTSPTWLWDYKKNLLIRILEDLEKQKKNTRIR